MKKIILVFCLTGIFGACTEQKHEEKEETASHETHSHENHKKKESQDWTEMDDYHMVMAETFHPAEENDFEPIKTKAEELAQSAETWKNSTPPAQFDKPEIKKILVLLADESRALAEFVKTNPSDEELFKNLTALHDRFHEVMGACHHE